MKNKKYIRSGILSLFLLVILVILTATAFSQQTTTVSVSPSRSIASFGEYFTVNISVDPATPIAGVQFDIHFDPAIVTVSKIEEGDLLNQNGASTYFSPGTIDNTAGTITGVAGAITTPGQTVSSPSVFATIHMTAKSVEGSSTLNLSNVIVGDINGNPVPITVNNGSVTVGKVGYFDTGAPSNPYPSIAGTHNGTITPNRTITVNKLYTYPCPGTGGHTEYARIWNKTWNATATWNGYASDWHNISFNNPVVLLSNETYNYTIRTGSYPQIHHNKTLTVPDGEITCTKFIDANGRVYYDWIPAIKLS